jgi:hypothetical protein
MTQRPIKVWNGTAWEYTGPAVAAPPVKYQATEPTSPATGDVWVESDYDVASVDPSKLLTGGVYTNESTRSAAIPTPTTGMVTYVGDTGTDPSTIPQIETYTGSQWQTPYGLTLLANQSFVSATTINIDNVFTNAFDNYYITFSPTASTVTTNLNIQFRAGGTTTTTNYNYQNIESSGTSVVGTNGTTGFIGITGGTAISNFIDVSVFKPNLATNTNYFGRSFLVLGGTNYNNDVKGVQASSTQFDGVQFTSGSTMTAVVSVYGYRKS